MIPGTINSRVHRIFLETIKQFRYLRFFLWVSDQLQKNDDKAVVHRKQEYVYDILQTF